MLHALSNNVQLYDITLFQLPNPLKRSIFVYIKQMDLIRVASSSGNKKCDSY
uniref:Uncharacterized protein n=1 Tax=Rhizophora mucronata TaxID=61149 RepID=A0A2P2N3H8_RHIMU